MSKKKKNSDIPAWITITGMLVIGIVIGLVAPQLFGVAKHKLKEATPPPITHSASTGTSHSPEKNEEPKTSFDFYKLLPAFQVVVPKQDKSVTSDSGKKPVDKPGAYVLQVASVRHYKDADALNARLALLGLDAHIQPVKIGGGETWNRVRIGPITNLKKLNHVRKVLANHQYQPLLIQVAQ